MPKVAIIVENTTIQEGAFRYAVNRPDWEIVSTFGSIEGQEDKVNELLANHEGVIIEPRNAETRMKVAELNIPAVVVSDQPCGQKAWVYHDDHMVGRMAADHLSEKSLMDYVFFGWMYHCFAQNRFEGFSERLSGSRISAKCIDGKSLDKRPSMYFQTLGEELKQYQRPFGLFAAYDYLAQLAIQAAKLVGMRVPEDMSVLGVDNAAGYSSIPISSVAPDHEGVGFVAAETLDKMLKGKPHELVQLLPPEKLYVRASSDCDTNRDKDISKAYQFIKDRMDNLISVEELANGIGMSRRNLYYIFERRINRTPSDEIIRIHLEKARELLRTTRKTIKEIAKETGFSSAKHLWKHFTKSTGMTPSGYRKSFGP